MLERLVRSGLSVVLAALMLMACQDKSELVPTAPTRDALSTPLSSRTFQREARAGEAFMEALASAMPGFGGIFLDDQERLVVRVLNVQDRGALVIVPRLLRAHGLDKQIGLAGRTIVLDTAQFLFRQLAAYRDIVSDQLVGQNGVRFVDLDEKNNRVTLGTEDISELATTSFRRAAANLGVDTAALAFEHVTSVTDAVDEARTAFVSPPCATLRSDGCSPVVAGLQVQRQSSDACTVGFVVLQQGVKRWVTASHCSPVKFGGDAAAFRQASWATGASVGSEFYDKPYWICGIGAYRCRNSDASLMTTAADVNAQVGLIARTNDPRGPGLGPGSTTIDGSRPYFIVTAVNGISGVFVGQQVHKVGRTTGWTFGSVSNTCVDYVSGVPTTWTKVNCADRADMTLNDGDSGGPVFTRNGDALVTLVGVVTAQENGGARTVFSRYQGVRSDLEQGNTWTAIRTATLAAPTVSGSVSNNHPLVSWAGISGATNYDIHRQYYQIDGYDEFGNPVYEAVFEWVGSTSGTSFLDSGMWVVSASPCAWFDEAYYWAKTNSETEFSGPGLTFTFCRQ